MILPEDFYISLTSDVILNEEDVDIFSIGSKIFNKIERCTFRESGVAIVGIKEHFINFYKYSLLKGDNYIDLPKHFKNSSKGLINIKNTDDKCFMWCHTAHISNCF